MSGHKRATVTISEEEYRRLHQADIMRRFRRRGKDAGPSGHEDFSETLKEMQNRQQQLERALNHLDEDFGWIGAEMMQDVLTQNARYYTRLAELVTESTSNADASLTTLSQRYTEELQREREQFQHEMQSLVQRLDTYEQREQLKAEAARQWLKRCAAFADFVREQCDHERFLPGRLSRILGSLSLAQDNLAGGLLEASLLASQQAFLELSDLQVELERRTIEWQREYRRVYRMLTQLIAELEMNPSLNALGLDGQELPVLVDLDYWSDGKYRQLLGKSRNLLEILLREQPSISAGELARMNTEVRTIIEERFESIIYEARLKALHSQLRMNIAEQALHALENQGFRLSASGYSNEDMRSAFTADLENPDGSRVLIEVIPAGKPEQDLTSELVMMTTHPYLKTEHEARLHWQELCRALNQFDLNVSRPEILATAPEIPEGIQPPPRLPEPLTESTRHHHV